MGPLPGPGNSLRLDVAPTRCYGLAGVVYGATDKGFISYYLADLVVDHV